MIIIYMKFGSKRSTCEAFHLGKMGANRGQNHMHEAVDFKRVWRKFAQEEMSMVKTSERKTMCIYARL